MAAASAFVDTMPSTPGKTRISMGAATFHGEHAISLNVSHLFKPRSNGMTSFLFGGVSGISGNEHVVRVGGGLEF